MERPPAADSRSLLHEIGALIGTPGPGQPEEPSRAHLERTLTDGYAHALALEGERWRLERRIGELAGRLHDGDRDRNADELAALSERLSSASAELTRLRALLARLRERHARAA